MKIIYRGNTWELEGRTTVRDAIKRVGLHPQAVLALRDGKLVTDDALISGDDVVELIAVVSGG